MLPVKAIDCPYCGESIDLLIDDSCDRQSYVEDCSVCCRPIEVEVLIEGRSDITIICRTDSEV